MGDNYDSVPNVGAYAASYGATINYPPPDTPTEAFKTFRDRRAAADIGRSAAPINGQLPFAAPQLLTNDQLRWQLGMVVVGGFTGLLLYSYMFRRPVFL
jgi:hypothetical protein